MNGDAIPISNDAAPRPPPPPPQPQQPPPPSTSAALLGLPNRWDANQLRSWLRDDLHCDFTTCRKKKGGPLAFVTFPSVDARRAADAAVRRAKKLPGGGRPLLRDERPSKHQRQQQQQKGLQKTQTRKRACEIDVRDVVTPLWRLPYAKQLGAKASRLRGVLERIEAGIGIGSNGGNGSSKHQATKGIDFLGILRSPTTDGYRNKCEFTVGLGVVGAKDGDGDGKGRGGDGDGRDGEAECGFCLGAYREGIVEVGPVSQCRNVSGVAKACAEAFARFMRDRSGESGLRPWDKRHNRGFWRLLIVREGRKETVLPRPEEVNSVLSPPLTPPPPPFASLDWRPWLVPSSELGEEAAEAEAEGKEKEEEQHEEAAAPSAPPPPPAASSSSPSSSPTPFEPPPADEILLVVQVDPENPEAKQADPSLVRSELAALGGALREAVSTYCSGFSNGASSSSSSVSVPRRPHARLVLQHHSGLSNSAPDDAPLLPWPGEEEEEGKEGKEGKEKEMGFITDALCGLRFRVSPSSFFQVNSGAAALLYRLALDWAGLEKKKEEEEEEEKKTEEASGNGNGAGEGEGNAANKGAENGETASEDSSSSVFLDVCCGTGTIGICAAAAGARRVVGVDVVEAAVRDAEANARANGLSLSSPSSSSPSCRFVAAKAEDVMASLLKEEEASGANPRFVAVVDPPRAGLHPKVRNALRGCSAVSRVVYVSCNPDTLASDCIHLCSRGGFGKGFRPVKAVAADLFPMTNHCEAVVLLER